MLEMLTEMVSPKELFRLVAFTEFMNFNQIFNPVVPISGEIEEFFATETTGAGRGVMDTLECSFIFRHGRARPRVAP